MDQAIFKTTRTKRAFFLPVDCMPWNPKRSRRCQDELDTRVELCASLVGSINRLVRYISQSIVHSARFPTLYLRGVVQPRLAQKKTLDGRTISPDGSLRFRKLSVSHRSRQHVSPGGKKRKNTLSRMQVRMK